MKEMTLPEAARALSNYLDHACEHCFIKNNCTLYLKGDGNCGHKQAVSIGIECINEEIAILNLSRAIDNRK